jgi:hypothetical protein
MLMTRDNLIKVATFVTTIGGAIVFLTTHGASIIKNFNSSTAERLKIILCGGNLLALITYYVVSIKTPNLRFKRLYTQLNDGTGISGKQHYCSLLDTMSGKSDHTEKDADWYNTRVNRLVNQLNNNICWYALCLMIVYALYIIDYDYEFNGNKLIHPNHNYFKILADIFNYLSSVFLYISFLVLYNETLDQDNRPNYSNNRYFRILILLSLLYLGFYAFLGVNATDKILINRLSLFAGMANGLAMVLLFARYISMDHTVQHIKGVGYSNYISDGMIYLLPVYAIVQPLFGTFQIEAFGDKIKFANSVFFFCLIGKMFFLFVTYLFIKKKLIHLYLHIVATPHNIPMLYETCFYLPEKDLTNVNPGKSNPPQPALAEID